MFPKFDAVLSIICGFLMAILYLDPFTTMYCCCAVVSEIAKATLASGLQTLTLKIKLTPEYPFNKSPTAVAQSK